MADRHKECFHGMAFCRCDVSTGAKSGMPVEPRHRILPQQYPIDILSLVEDEVDSGNSDDDSSSSDSDDIRSALEAPRCEKPESPLTVSFPGPGYPKSQVPDPDDVDCIRDCDRPENRQMDEGMKRFQDQLKKRSLARGIISKMIKENQEIHVTCTPWTLVNPEEMKEGESGPSVAQMFSTPLNSPGNKKPPEPVAKSTADRPVLHAPIIASPKPPPNERENAMVEPQSPVVEVPPPVKCSVCLKDIQPTTEVYYQWKCLDMCAFFLHKTCLHEEMAKQGFKKKREFKDAICATEGCSAAISAISEFSMVNKESLYIKSEHDKLEKVENKKLDKLKPVLAKDQKKTKKDVNTKKAKNDRDHATPETTDSNQSSVRTPEEQIEEAVMAQPVVIMPAERPVVLEEPRKHNPLTVEIDEVAVPLQKKTDELENKYTVTKQKTTFKQKTKKKREVLDVFVPRPIRLPSGGFDDYLPASTSFNSNYVPDRWDDDRSVAASTASQDSRSTGVLRIHDPQQFPDSIGATVTFPLPGTNSGEMFMEEILDRIAPRFDDVVINSHKEGANRPVHELLDAILLTTGDLLEQSKIEFIKKIFTGEDPTVLRMFIQGLKYFTVAKSGNLFTYCKNQKGRILQDRFIQEQELAKVALQQQQQPVEVFVPQEVPQEQKMPQQQEVPQKTPQQPVDAYVPQKQKKPRKLPQQQELPRQETSYVPQEKPQQQTQVQLKMDGNTWNFASIIKNERGEFLVQSGHRPTWHNDSNGFYQYENNGGYYEEDQGEYVEEQEFYDAEEPVDFIPTNPRTESAVTSSSSHESSLLMDQVMAAGLSGAERERLEQQKNADMDKKIAWKMATLDLKAQMRKEEQERLSCVSEEDDWGHRDFNDNSANEEANWGNGVNSVIPPLLRSNLAPSSLSINDDTTDWHGKEDKSGFSFPPGFDRQPFAELSQTSQLVFKEPEPQQEAKNVVSEERYLKAMEQCQRSTEASNELEERLKAMEIQLDESYRRRDESEQKLKAVEEEKATVAAACNEKDAEVQSLNARLREQNIAKDAAEKRLRETALRHLKAEAERKLQEILSAIHHNGIIIKKVMECVGPEFAEIVEELAENHRCWETQEQIARKRLELIEAGVVEVPGLPQPPILSDKMMAFFQKAKDTGKCAYHPMMERFYKYVKNQLQRFSEIAGKEMCSSAQVQNMLTTELQNQHEKDFDVNLAVRRMASTLGYHRFKETASIPPTLRPSAPPAAKPGPAGGRSTVAPAAVGKKKKASPKNVLKITAQKKNAWGPSTSATDRAVDVAEANCEICLDPMVVSETLHACALCKEPFHRQCVLAWLEKQGTCPHCRGNMPHPGHYPALR